MRKPLRGGAVTTFGVAIANGGGRAVEITGVGPAATPDDAAERRDRLTPAGARMNPTDGPAAAQRTVPFRPFTLRPDRQRFVEVALLMAACSSYEPGSVIGFDSVDVRFRSLVFEREQAVALPAPVEIVRGRDCVR